MTPEPDEDYGPAECQHCGGAGFLLTCCDDICHGQGYCMHGDGEEVCPACDGEGE